MLKSRLLPKKYQMNWVLSLERQGVSNKLGMCMVLELVGSGLGLVSMNNVCVLRHNNAIYRKVNSHVWTEALCMLMYWKLIVRRMIVYQLKMYRDHRPMPFGQVKFEVKKGHSFYLSITILDIQTGDSGYSHMVT